MMTVLGFSPTGQSRTCALAVANAMKRPFREWNVTRPWHRNGNLVVHDDLLIVYFPVYAGRVPSLLVDYLQNRFSGIGCKAAVIATWGNRAYDDALVEMEDLLRQKGVEVIGGAAIVAQHSYTAKVGEKRPDIADFQLLDKLSMDLLGGGAPIHLPGNRPYRTGIRNAKPYYMPIQNASCIECGQCNEVCPTDAMLFQKAERCIHCCACMGVCPVGALCMQDERFSATVDRLEHQYSEPQKSEVFLSANS